MTTKQETLTDGAVYQLDCCEGFSQLQAGTVDLVFADPPFNIGYEYDVYDDRRAAEEYLTWCRKWMQGVARALTETGSFWLAIGDEFAAELKMIAQNDCGFHCRSWVIWYYTFGVNCVRGFSRSHTHLFHFVKDPREFTFEVDNPEVRIPSARQLVYGDRRANPKGRLPDNTWVLRPQDVDLGFTEDHDVWYFPRVAGTFKERQGFHGCQMPEQLLARIIRLCSRPNELVVDPFTGSGTTLAVAKKLGRRWLGFDISSEYVERATDRLQQVGAGDPLDGAADPARSVPKTTAGRRLSRRLDGETFGNVSAAANDILRGLTSRPAAASVAVDDTVREEFEALLRSELKRRLPGDVWQPVLAERLAHEDWSDSNVSTLPPIDATRLYWAAAEIVTQMCESDLGLPLSMILLNKKTRSRFDELGASFGVEDPALLRWAALLWTRESSRFEQLPELDVEWRVPRESSSLESALRAPVPANRTLLAVVESDLGIPLFVHVLPQQRWSGWLRQLLDAPAWRRRGAAAVRWCVVPDPGWHVARSIIRELNPPLNSRRWRTESVAHTHASQRLHT